MAGTSQEFYHMIKIFRLPCNALREPQALWKAPQGSLKTLWGIMEVALVDSVTFILLLKKLYWKIIYKSKKYMGSKKLSNSIPMQLPVHPTNNTQILTNILTNYLYY